MNSPPAEPVDAHVVMLAQYLPLHFASTMRQLGKRVRRLTLLVSEPMDRARDWSPDHRDLTVRVQKSWRFGVTHRHPLGFEDSGTVIVPYSTIADLFALRPTVVISVEVGARTLQAAAVRAMSRRFKLIVQVRESENTAQSRGPWRWRLRRSLLPRMDGIFVNGASGFRHVLSCGVEATRISVVPSGTDTEVFGGGPVSSNRDGPLRLLYVGQLTHRKGLMPFAEQLLSAAAQSPRGVEWSLAGRGPLESALRGLPWPANVRLSFLGSQPYRALPEVYAGADVFIMPSLSDEWGMVVNEAMASGLPVLGCTGVQAVDELVADGRSGWTYGPTDADGLRHALSAVLSAPREDLRLMGSRARRRALEVSDADTARRMAAGVAQVLGFPLPDR